MLTVVGRRRTHQVAGKLQVELSRIAGELPDDRMCQSESDEDDDEHGHHRQRDPDAEPPTITCRVAIKQVPRNVIITKKTRPDFFWSSSDERSAGVAVALRLLSVQLRRLPGRAGVGAVRAERRGRPRPTQPERRARPLQPRARLHGARHRRADGPVRRGRPLHPSLGPPHRRIHRYDPATEKEDVSVVVDAQG